MKTSASLRVLLSHSPDQIDWARRFDFDLMLAGHNHGGQIRPPYLGALITPTPDPLNQALAKSKVDMRAVATRFHRVSYSSCSNGKGMEGDLEALTGKVDDRDVSAVANAGHEGISFHGRPLSDGR